MPFDTASSNEEQSRVKITPLSVGGKPALVQGALVVTVQSGNATVGEAPTEGNHEFVARSGDDPGVTVYLVKGDADLGEGVKEISDTVTYTVTGAQAANLGFSATVEPKV